jgi:hypothetical protein
MKTIKFLLAMLLLATTACATFADEPAVKQPGLSEAVKTKILSQVEALRAKESPFTGKTVSCSGANNEISVPTVGSGGVASAAVLIPKLAIKGTFLQIKSTIQCSTSAGTDRKISSIMAIVDSHSHVFCAEPDPFCDAFFACGANESYQHHTGIWWFDPLHAVDVTVGALFFPGPVVVGRVDFGVIGDETIAFRSLCVDVVK